MAGDKFLRKSGLYWDSHTKSTKEVTNDEVAEELKRPDSKLAYSTKTRDYFLRRAITGFADFVAMVNPEKGAEFQEQVKRIKEKLKQNTLS